MTINFNVIGAERKRLVQLISEITGSSAKYLGVPSCAYRVGNYTLSKDGELIFEDGADISKLELLIERLAEHDFEAEITETIPVESLTDEPEKAEQPTVPIEGLVIELPRTTFTDRSLENLKQLLESKGELIKKALQLEELPLEVTDERVSFLWFPFQVTPEEIKAYSHFICSLAELAREQKRVTTKARVIENEKYAFRCFLLRLGFIGDQYKDERKILLSKLTGSSAFKSGEAKQKEVE
ncbi:hypothetical protein [Youngiibacter fragilis]|uniref:Virulence protein n=1 Tax=Youngiibacter fragilis 232.1 TaxID=994573 RepID=V7I415_9CLOT|nr:hypothetical protein [Youngiibacter fragilis]ETA80990.1 virulence protein [Youngiibacter fragilis 232.1]